MGIGMQIVCIGDPGAASLEAEAAIHLLRLQPYSRYFSDCQLAIEHFKEGSESARYEVSLEIRSSTHPLRRTVRCAHDTAEAAIACVFSKAALTLRILVERLDLSRRA